MGQAYPLANHASSGLYLAVVIVTHDMVIESGKKIFPTARARPSGTPPEHPPLVVDQEQVRRVEIIDAQGFADSGRVPVERRDVIVMGRCDPRAHPTVDKSR